MTVLEYLKVTFNAENPNSLRKRIKCADGFSLSVQGGTPHHYCQPREHVNEYEAVEIGFPSAEDSLILEYAEESDSPTHTVYGYVPLEIVEELISKHGGITV